MSGEIMSACGCYLFRSDPGAVEEAPGMLADVDIGLVPRNADSWRIGSDLKGLEMAGMGVPCVASPTPAYVTERPEGTGCVVLLWARSTYPDIACRTAPGLFVPMMS